MSTTINLTCNNFNVTDWNNPSAVKPKSSLSTYYSFASGQYFFIDFSSLSSSYLYKKVISAYLYACIHPAYSGIGILQMFYLTTGSITDAWSPSTICYANQPSSTTTGNSDAATLDMDTWVYANINWSIDTVRKAVTNGIRIKPSSTIGFIYTKGTNNPYLNLVFSDDNAYIRPTSLSPSSGHIAKYTTNTFSWSKSQYGECIGNLALTNCKFRWRPVGATSYNEVNCGTSLSYTMPSGTISADNIEWSVAITDSGGTTTSSSWYQLTTDEGTGGATINFPKGTIIDGTVDQVFSWNHVIDTGTLPTGSDLQYRSAATASWSSLATISGSATTTTIPANTFSTGQWYWRVRTKNTDSQYGSWSTEATFIVADYPVTEGVTATQTPRPLISWQGLDQQGYQVKVGNWNSGVKYGTAHSLKYPSYLPDGNYTVMVRMANQYGLWSEWLTASLTVSNVSLGEITLSALHDNGIAYLSWSASATCDEYIVYRDNVPIYKTTETSYTDQLALGTVSYKIRGVNNTNDNYVLSNSVDLNIKVDCMMIANINTLSWLRLDKSTSVLSEISLSHNNQSVTEHIFGEEYPYLEMSKYKDKVLSGKAAFTDSESALAFSRLNNKCVAVKTPKGAMVVGLMSSVNEVQNTFFYGFSFSVQQTYFVDEVEI